MAPSRVTWVAQVILGRDLAFGIPGSIHGAPHRNLLKLGDSSFQLPFAPESVAEVMVRDRVIRAEVDGLAVLGNRSGQVPFLLEPVAEDNVVPRKLRLLFGQLTPQGEAF